MIVRRASAEDLERIATVHRNSILELCKEHYSVEQLEHWTAALHASAYSTLLHTHEVLVAEENGTLLGFCVFDPGAGFLNATYVHPTAVRRGVGRRPVRAAEVAARGTGCAQMRLHATLNAVRFYEELGYATVEPASNRLSTGLELPCVVMSKALAS